MVAVVNFGSARVFLFPQETLRKRLQTLKKAIDDADRQRKANAGKKIQADLAAKLSATPPGDVYIEYIPDANQKVVLLECGNGLSTHLMNYYCK